MVQDTVKRQIFGVAKSLFSKRGVRDVGVDEICHELGISKKTFYQYYGSKEALVGEMIDLHLVQVKKAIDTACEGKSCVEMLFFFVNYRPRGEFMLSEKVAGDIEKYYHDTFVEHTRKVRELRTKEVMAYLQAGARDGSFRSDIDMDAVVLILAMIHDSISRYLKGDFIYGGRKRSAKSLYASFEDMALHCLLTPKGWEEMRALQDNTGKKHK